MKAALLAVSVLALLISSSGALTVTLTGTCSGIYRSNSTEYVNFLLNNSGNGPAANLTFIPASYGISLSAQNATLPVLYPGNISTTRFYVGNATRNGTYAFGMYVSYVQGGQIFVVTFPCLVSLGRPSERFVYISNISVSGNRISAEVTSVYGKTVNVSLSFIAPPTFTITPRRTPISMNGSSVDYVNVSIDKGRGFNGQVTLTGVVSYIIGNTSYASIATLPISLVPQQGSSTIDITWLVIGGIVATIFALIIASLLLNRKRRSKGAAA